MFLLEGEPEHAISPLRRALAGSPGSNSQPAAVLTLAAAYILNGNFRLANVILGDYHKTLGQQPYNTTGIFLGAYAHYLAQDEQRRQGTRQGSDLLAALWGVTEERVLGPVGKLLIGRAYRDLGLNEEMAAVYQKALPRSKGPLAAEMAYVLAEDLFARNQRKDAARLYAALSKQPGGKWVDAAQIRLAEIALQDDRPQDSLVWCRKFLNEKRTVDRPKVLKLMGQAYEKTGDYRRAALCFGGVIPTE